MKGFTFIELIIYLGILSTVLWVLIDVYFHIQLREVYILKQIEEDREQDRLDTNYLMP